MFKKTHDQFDLFLNNLKHRFLLRASISSIALATALFLAGLSLLPVVNLVLKEYDIPSAFYLFLFVLLLLSSLYLIGNLFLLRNESSVIKNLKDHLTPPFTDELLSALEFKSNLTGHHTVSRELMEAHINKVKERLSVTPLLPLPLLSPEARSYLTAGALSFIFVLAIYSFSPDSRNLLKSIFKNEILQEKALVQSVDIRYIFPAYTGEGPLELKNTDGNISAIRGSMAELHFQLKERADSAQILLGSGSQIPLSKDGDGFKGSLNIDKDDTYTIEFRKGRRRLRDPFSRVIHALEDSHPLVDALVEGGKERIAPGDLVQFVYHASDDFGIQRITLKCETPSGKTLKNIIKETSLVRKEISGEYLWDTSSFKLGKEEKVQCYISVFDNDSISGPKEGRSAVFHFKTGTATAKEILLEEVKALFEEGVNALALILEQERKNIDRKFIAELSRTISELKDKSSKIVQNLLSSGGKLREYLLRTDSELSSILTDIPALRKNNKKDNLLKSVTEKLEKVVLDLYTLLRFGRYESFLNTAEDILAYQQSLLEEFKSSNTSDLYKKIEDMERGLQEMFSNLASSQGFTEEFINPEALKEMGSFSLFEKLKRIKSLLKEGRVEEAKRLFEEFMSEYNEMIARMKEFINSTTLAEFGEFLKQLDSLQKNLKGLISREAKIKSGLKNITEGQKRGDLNEWIKKELEKVVELKKQAHAIEKETQRFNIQGPKEAKRRVELLQSYLKNAGLYDALREAKASLSNFESLRFHPELKKEGKLSDEINSAISLNREIIKDIENVLNNLQTGLDDKSKQKLQEFSREQGDIERRTRELSKELDKAQSEEKLLKTPIPEMLSGAADFMKGAKKRLDNLDPEGGLKNVDEALDQLGKIDDLIEGMKSGKNMPMFIPFFAQGEGAYGDTTGRVELPGEEETAYQKEIKEELLKAIRGGLPDKLEEENRKYLKELLK